MANLKVDIEKKVVYIPPFNYVYVLLSLLSGCCLRGIHVSLFDVMSRVLIQVYRT